jgi:hypothetical protein
MFQLRSSLVGNTLEVGLDARENLNHLLQEAPSIRGNPHVRGIVVVKPYFAAASVALTRTC